LNLFGITYNPRYSFHNKNDNHSTNSTSSSVSTQLARFGDFLRKHGRSFGLGSTSTDSTTLSPMSIRDSEMQSLNNSSVPSSSSVASSNASSTQSSVVHDDDDDE
jgi:hypothetical protein